MVDELQGTYRGMMMAIPPQQWQGFADMPVADLADFLKDLAAKVNLKRFLKATRQKKKRNSRQPMTLNTPMYRRPNFYLVAK